MRLGEHDEDYIWLRQSATFVVNGQTRTVEIAIPVRRGCTPAELESLLDEADAGMARLSRHLDARIAEQQGTAPPAPPPAEPAEPAPRPAPAASERTPASAAHPVPPPSSIAERPAPPPRTPPPAAPAPRSAPSPAPTERPRPAPPVAAAGEPLTIAAFLAAVSAELGYNARQAMDELGVRTLSGLNLREALETLRRKHVRAGAAPVEAPPPPPTPAPSTRPAPAAAPEPPAPASPRYFDEEDDAGYTFDLEDEDALAPEDTSHLPDAAFGALAEDEPPPLGDDDFDLAGDLPDFDALPPPPEEPAPAPPARARPAPRPQASTSRASSAATPAPARSTGPLVGAEHMRGLPRLGQLRAVTPGNAATAWQRNAYHNLVVSQLGEEAARLVAGVWRTTPAQLGGDQLDALIRWAKEDAFQEEARQVLAAISAERARAAHGAHATDGASGADAASPRSAGRASASGTTPRRAASPRSRDGEGGR